MIRLFAITSIILAALGITQAQESSAGDILQLADAVVNAPRDQDLTLKLVLIDANGNEKIRKANMLQKGKSKRKIRFLYPADQEGIAFLDLPEDRMYLYLPAFKKVRRIAGHIRNQKFAGTDLTYDDMATASYAEEHHPRIVEKTSEHTVLDLTPKRGTEKNYSKLRMWVRNDNYYPEKIEYYNNNIVWKISRRGRIEQVGGYWISKEYEIHDLVESHKTVSILEEAKFDTGLEDKLFTERYLKR